MKKLIVMTTLISALAMPTSVQAETTCTQAYGQPVVCGVDNEEHFPVQTGIADVSLNLLGSGSIIASGFLYFLSKRKNQAL